MRILGVDYGTARIGLAVGDTSSRFAFPLRSIVASPEDAALAAVVAAAKDEDAARIVVGVPYALDPSRAEPRMQKEAAGFVAALKEKTALQVDTEDERMTSALADRWRSEAGKKKKDFDKDAAAAAAILDSYMTRLERQA